MRMVSPCTRSAPAMKLGYTMGYTKIGHIIYNWHAPNSGTASNYANDLRVKL